MLERRLKPGDVVIYRVLKHTSRPGPRARDISPSLHGETYSYFVDKYWVVAEARSNGSIVVFTRRGKRRVVDAESGHLRRAGWVDWLMHRSRFPRLPREIVAAAH